MTRYPEVVVGAYVFNNKDEVLLVRSPKWKNGKMWVVAGGHIEWGETIEEAVVREVKEELGIKVKYEGMLATMEGVFPDYFQDKRHFIYLQCKCKILPGEEIEIDGREIVEAKWWKIEEALELREGELHPKTREVLEKVQEERFVKEGGLNNEFIRSSIRDVKVRATVNKKRAWQIAEESEDYFEIGMEEIKRDLERLDDLYGVFVEEEMVGFVVYEKKGLVAEIKWLAVLPNWRGKGLGSRLVEESMRLVGARLVKVKTLAETHPDEGYARTRRFYEKLGFLTVEIIDPYPGWGEGNPCQIMVRCVVGE